MTDILIVSTQNETISHYWKIRLAQTKNALGNPLILVVSEDWPGGAGNAFGTLYAYQKAQNENDIDLNERLLKGASIILYHTAGDGKRLYPLTASEYNNKSALKLPGLIQCNNSNEPITLLEAVIKQTSKYAPSRKGRLSVFWGDQIFLPNSYSYLPNSHVDILIKAIPPPNDSDWLKQSLHTYGFYFRNTVGQSYLLEKGSFSQYQTILKNSSPDFCGISLGCFSLSHEMLAALLSEFKAELALKNRKMDTDLHWWMAGLLDLENYALFAKNQAAELHARMQSVKKRLSNTSRAFFGAVDIGKDSPWWDLGTTGAFYANLLKMTKTNSAEGQLLRNFFDVTTTTLGCHIKQASVRNSILVNVEAEEVDIEDCVIINAKAPIIKGRGGLIYNAQANQELRLNPGDIYTTINQQPFYSQLKRNPKEDWNALLQGNSMTWSDLHQSLVLRHKADRQ